MQNVEKIKTLLELEDTMCYSFVKNECLQDILNSLSSDSVEYFNNNIDDYETSDNEDFKAQFEDFCYDFVSEIERTCSDLINTKNMETSKIVEYYKDSDFNSLIDAYELKDKLNPSTTVIDILDDLLYMAYINGMRQIMSKCDLW